MFLEDSNWQSADEYCEKVLDLDPENAEAYLGKLMAELHVRTRDTLKDVDEPFDDSNNYKKAFRFGDDKLKEKLSGDISFINERNENARLTGIYNTAVRGMNAASTESAYKSAAATFKTIPGFKDADALAERCLEQAEICRKDEIYQSARSKMRGRSISDYESAIQSFRTIPGWKDADEQIFACQRRIEEIKEQQKKDKEEAERRVAEEAKRQAEERVAKEIAKEKAAKKRKKIAAIVIPIIVACIAFVIVLTTVIIPKQKLNKAMGLLDSGDYETAYALLEEIGNSDAIASSKYERAVALIESGNYDTALLLLDGLNYKDSAAQIEKCETAIRDEKFAGAVELYTAGKYEEAIAAFTALDGYKDSAAQIEKCETAIKDGKYAAAVELFNAGKYEEAIAAFTALNGYKDCAVQITECRYAIAMELYNAGQYEEAIAAFTALNGYKDSTAQIDSFFIAKYGEEIYTMIKSAEVGSTITFGGIEWIVIDKNDTALFLLSKYALFEDRYCNSINNRVALWSDSDIRKKLNGSFLNRFSETEYELIQTVTIETDADSYITTTEDKVFLLSKKETELLDSLKCQTGPQGDYCEWWLRSSHSGVDSDMAFIVDIDTIHHCRVGVVDKYIRPAMWIDLSADN